MVFSVVKTQLEKATRYTLTWIFRKRVVNSLWSKISRQVLYTQGFHAPQLNFLTTLREHRLHITDAASGTDFDVTFIEHGVTTPALNDELLGLMESSAGGLRQYNQSLAQWIVAG